MSCLIIFISLFKKKCIKLPVRVVKGNVKQKSFYIYIYIYILSISSIIQLFIAHKTLSYCGALWQWRSWVFHVESTSPTNFSAGVDLELKSIINFCTQIGLLHHNISLQNSHGVMLDCDIIGSNLKLHSHSAQLAGAIEYTGCISAEG